MRFVQVLLHIEGLAIGGAAIWLFFAHTELSWLWLALLFLADEREIGGVAFGGSAATRAYNLTHTYVAPVALAGAGLATGEELLLGLVFIWGAHVGVDRFAGYGLKYSLAPKSTHLQRVAEPGAQRAVSESAAPAATTPA